MELAEPMERILPELEFGVRAWAVLRRCVGMNMTWVIPEECIRGLRWVETRHTRVSSGNFLGLQREM